MPASPSDSAFSSGGTGADNRSLTGRWRQISRRSQQSILLSAAVLAALLLWIFVLAPSLATWRNAAFESDRLGAQLQHMQQMQARAQALQKQPPLGYEDALRLLTASTRQLLGGTAQLSSAADRVSVTLQAASPDALADWLAQARQGARSVPLEARLQRVATASGALAWSGVLLMSMPVR